MPLIPGKSKKSLNKDEMEAGKPSLAVALNVQRTAGKKKKKLAEGGKVGGAETSTTGNKTKTGGSNPGGASTGGAGTVTITTGAKPPKNISVSDVGGRTDSRNAGGMDPSDEDDKDTMHALGGAVEGETHSKKYDRDPGAQAKKPDDSRRPKDAYLSKDWAGSPELDDASDTSMRPAKDQYASQSGHWAKGGEIHPMDLMSDDERATSIADAILSKRKRMAEGGQVDLAANSEEEGSSPFDDMNSDAGGAEQFDDGQLEAQPKDSNESGDAREDASENKHDMISAIRAKMKARRS